MKWKSLKIMWKVLYSLNLQKTTTMNEKPRKNNEKEQ